MKKKQKSVRRYRRMIARSLFLALYIDLNARRLTRNKKMPFEKKFAKAIKFLKIYHKRLKVNVSKFGVEKIPADIKGCVFMGNHQGKDDCQVLLQALETIPTSYLINDARSHGFMLGSVTDFFQARRIKFEDLRGQVALYNEMADDIANGKRYIIFPEAKYDNNKNNLQEFNTPCFAPVLKTKCPIIPFVLWDTWRIYDDDVLETIDVECHILDPIYYEEYSGLNKKQLAELLKGKIQAKLDEISREKMEV